MSINSSMGQRQIDSLSLQEISTYAADLEANATVPEISEGLNFSNKANAFSFLDLASQVAEYPNAIISSRAKQFMQEYEDINICYPDGRLDCKVLVEKFEQNKVVFFFFNHPGIIVRLDPVHHTMHFINATPQPFLTGDFIVEGRANPYGKGIIFVKKFKQYCGFRLPADNNFKVAEFVQALKLLNSKSLLTDVLQKLLYNLPRAFHLTPINSGDSNTFPERYFELQEVDNAPYAQQLSLFYTLQGVFEESSSFGKEANLVLQKVMFQKVFIHLKQSYENENHLSKIEASMSSCFRLVGLANFLHSEGILEDSTKTFAALDKIRKELLKKKNELQSTLHNETNTFILFENSDQSKVQIHLEKYSVEALPAPNNNASAPATSSPLSPVEKKDNTRINEVHRQFSAVNFQEMDFKAILEQALEDFKSVYYDYNSRIKFEMTKKGEITHQVDEHSYYFKGYILKELDQYIKKLISILPVPKRAEENIWLNSLNPKQREEYLDLLEQVQQSLFELNAQTPLKRLFDYHLLALIDALARKDENNKLTDAFKTYVDEINYLYTSPRMTLPTGILQQNALALIQYFDPHYQYCDSFYKKRTEETFKEAILDHTFALISMNQLFSLSEIKFTPMKWSPLHSALDKQGQTYRFYRQFIDDENIISEWKKLGKMAPQSEEEKVLWIVTKVINGNECLPKSISILQRAVLRTIYASLEVNMLSTESLFTPTAVIHKEPVSLLNRKLVPCLNILIKGNSQSVDFDVPCLEAKANDWKTKKPVLNFNRQIPILRVFEYGDSVLPRGNQNTSLPYIGPEKTRAETREMLIKSEISQISSNPLDMLNRLVGFFSKNYSRLIRTPISGREDFLDIVLSLKGAFFQYNQLNHHLTHFPEFPLRIRKFFIEGAKVLFESNFADFTAWCKLYESIYSIIAHTHPELLKEFKELSEWLFKEILPICTDDAEKYRLHAVISCISRNPPLYSRFYFVLSHLLHSKGEFSEEKFHIVAASLKDIIIKSFSEEPSQKLESEIVKILYEVFNVTLEEPLRLDLENEILFCGRYFLDLKTFTFCLSERKILVSNLPLFILEQDSFKLNYPGKVKSIIPHNYRDNFSVTASEGGYELNPEGKRAHLGYIFISTSQPVMYFKEFNGIKHQLMRKTEILELALHYPLLRNNKFQLWLSENNDQILALAEHEQAIVIKISPLGDQIQVDSVSQGKNLIWHSTQVSFEIFLLFSIISIHHDICYYADRQTQKLCAISILNSNSEISQKLEIHIDGDNTFSVHPYTGYFIIQNGSFPKLRISTKCTLPLVNADGKIKQIFYSAVCKSWIEVDLLEGNWEPNSRLSLLALLFEYVEVGIYEECVELVKNISLISDFDSLEIALINALDQKISRLENTSRHIGLKINFELFIYDVGVKMPTLRTMYSVKLNHEQTNEIKAFNEVYRDKLIDLYQQYTNLGVRPAYSFLKTENEIRVLNIVLAALKEKLHKNSLMGLLKKMLLTREIAYYTAIKKALLGRQEVTYLKYPMYAEIKDKPTEWISPFVFFSYLRTFKKIIENRIVEEKALNQNWVKPKTFLEKLDLLSPINPNQPEFTEKSTFFHYYYYITEVATEEQRIQLSWHFELESSEVIGYNGRMFLKYLCYNPHQKPSLERLYSLFVRTDYSSTAKLYGLLIGLSALQYYSYSSGRLEIIQSCFDIASLWKTTKALTIPITAYVTPWVRPFNEDKGIILDCSAVDEEFTRLFRNLFEEFFVENAGKYSLKENISLDTVVKCFSQRLSQWQQTINTELQQLINLACNARHGDHQYAVSKLVERTYLDSTQIQALFAQATEEQFMEKTTFQDKIEFNKFLVLLTRHFMVKSRLGQLNAALIYLKDAQKSDALKDKPKQENLLNEAIKKLLAVPAYKRGIGRKERLLIAKEAQMGSLIRLDQFAKIQEIEAKSDTDVLYEAPLGYGKTVVIRPTSNALLQTTGLLVFNILPKSQELDLARNLERDAKLSFGTKVTRVYLKRNTPLDIIWLREEYARLSSKQRGTTTNDPESYQLISIHMDVLSNSYRNTPKKAIPAEALEKIQLCQSILRLLKVKGVGVFEEEDQIINPNYEIIFSLGTLYNYQEELAEVMGKVVDCLLMDPGYAEDIRGNNQENWSADELNGKIFNKIVNYFIEDFALSEEDAEQFQLFVQCPEEDAKFDSSYEWAEKQPLRNKFALLKGVLNIILEQARKGRINARDGYALSLLDNKYKVPIPCESKNQLKESADGRSQFHPDVALLRGLFYFHAKGLTFEEAVTMLKKAYARAQSTSRKGMPLSSTKEGQKYHKMLEKAGVSLEEYPIETLKSKKKLNALANILKGNPAAIKYFVETVVASQIQIYENTIERTTQFLRSMYRSTISLSATPQSDYTHGFNTEFSPISWYEEGLTQTAHDIRQMVLHKTGTPSEVRLQILESNLMDELLAECIEGALLDGASAIVEASPFFSNIPNCQIAQVLAQKLKSLKITAFKGILLFDEKARIPVVLDIESGTLQTLQTSDYREEELFKLYDEAAASNTDWKSLITALFKVTIGPHSTLEEVAQGMGRARMLHLLQSISFVMRNETYKDHFNGKEKLTPQDILDFLLKNSEISRKLRAFNALRDQMQNELISVLHERRIGLSSNKENWEQELKTPPNPLEAIRIFNENEDVLLTRTPVDPWEMYGALRKKCSSVKELGNDQTKCIADVYKSKTLDTHEKTLRKQNLENYSKRWIGEERVPLPDTVNAISSKVNAVIEVVRTVEKVPDFDQSIMERKSNPIYKPDKYVDNFNPFRPNAYQPSAFKQTLLKVISYAARLSETVEHISHACAAASGLFSIGAIIINVTWMGISTGVTFAISKFALAVFLSFAGIAVIYTFGAQYIRDKIFKRAYKALIGFETHSLKDVVAQSHSPHVKRVLKMFNGDYSQKGTRLNVLVSNNKHKVTDFENKGESPYFLNTKRLKQVLVFREILTDAEEILTLVDIDMNDSQQLMTILIKDREAAENDPNRTVEVGIYDVEADLSKEASRFVSYGKNGIDSEKIINNPAFHAGMALLKLHNAHIDLLPVEQNALTTRLVDHLGLGTLGGKKAIDEYLRNEVLEQKVDVQKNYQESILAAVLRV